MAENAEAEMNTARRSVLALMAALFAAGAHAGEVNIWTQAKEGPGP